MKFSYIATLFASVFAAPAAKTNYELLVSAITEFQTSSDYSWELIITALSQEKALLNSVSAETIGKLTIFLPSDNAFLSLNIAKLTQNDLYTYLQYHFALNAPSTEGYVRTYLGDDVYVNSTHVISALGQTANILGSTTVSEDVNIVFVDNASKPPLSLKETAEFYNWTNLVAVLDAAEAAEVTLSLSKDNTYLVPSEASIASVIEAGCPPAQWDPNFLTLLLTSLTFSSARVYSSQLAASGSIVSDSTVSASYTVEDGVVTFDVYGISAKVVEADIFVHGGVVHVIDASGLPTIKGFCKA